MTYNLFICTVSNKSNDASYQGVSAKYCLHILEPKVAVSDTVGRNAWSITQKHLHMKVASLG